MGIFIASILITAILIFAVANYWRSTVGGVTSLGTIEPFGHGSGAPGASLKLPECKGKTEREQRKYFREFQHVDGHALLYLSHGRSGRLSSGLAKQPTAA